MSGLPGTKVILDDGTGMFPYDISAYTRWSSGLSTTRGWADENEQNGITPGQAQLRLDNLDGRFTLGSTTYPGSSGTLQKDQRLRVTETVAGTTYTRLTGYVTDWPTQWESALGNLAYAAVTVSDRMARLNRRTMKSTLLEELLVDAPAALWTLTEAQGSTSTSDQSGNAGQPLTSGSSAVVSSLTPVVFGNPGVGFPAATGVTFQQPTGSQPQVLQTRQAPVRTAVAGITSEFFMQATPTASGGFLFQNNDAAGTTVVNAVALNSSGTSGELQTIVNGALAAYSGNVVDGQWHHVAYTWDGVTVRLYLDGALVASAASAGTPSLAEVTTVGALFRDGSVVTMSHVAEYATALSAARIKAHADAGLNYFAADHADQRLARLAAYAQIPTAEQAYEGGVQPSIAPADLAGKSALDAMRDVAAAEGGALFVNPAGALTLHNKEHRVRSAMGSPALTLTAGQYEPDVVFGSADDYLINTATGTRNGGAEQRAVNTASVAKYETYSSEHSAALLPSDQLLLDQLTWLVNVYDEPLPRLSSVTLDLLTLPTSVVQAALALEIGDLVRITGWPSQAPGGTGLVLDLIVEGIKENQIVSDRSATWQLTFNTAPAALFKAPIYDTPSATYDTGLPVYF